MKSIGSNNKLKALKQQQKVALKNKLSVLKSGFLFSYVPNDKQRLFHASGASFNERLFLAGNRCGKTFCGAMEMAMHLTGEYPSWWQGIKFNEPIRAWAASNTSESTRDILQAAYLGDEEQNIKGVIPQSMIQKTTMRRGVSGAVDTVYVKHKSGGISMLGFKSYDQGRQKFQGTSRHLIHLDEEPDIRIYEECLLRTLDVGGSIMLTMTPLQGMTDVCEHFIKDESDTKKVVQASWDDAHHLSTSEKNRLRKTLRPHELEAREKGIPSLGSGKIFPVKEADIACERFEIPPHFKHVFGLDFGWTNPTAIVWGAYNADEDVLYITDVYTVCEQPPSIHAEYIKHKGKWIPGVCDPAGRSSTQSDGISLMNRYAEHGVFLQQADNSVEAGLMNLLERMQSGKLKVFDDLEGWFKEFRLYRRDEKGRIVKRHDHLMDATRYLAVSGLQMARTKALNTHKRKPANWMGVGNNEKTNTHNRSHRPK